jgi:predicted dehydrogenase
MKKLRLSVVGAGAIGQDHIRVIQELDSCELHSLVDPSPSSLVRAQALAIPHFSDLQTMLERDSPDGVIIATPNELHVPQALLCIRKGVPVLLEKPIAASLIQGEELVRAVQAHQSKLMIGHHRAHSPIMKQAQHIIQSGELGQLVGLTASAAFYKPNQYFESAAWRSQPGGGPVLINLIHEIHNLRMLCGEMTHVQATLSNAVRQYKVEDTAAMIFRFKNGALGTFFLSDCAASSQSWEQTSAENPAYASYPHDNCYQVMGTKGSLSIPSLRIQRFSKNTEPSWFNAMEETRPKVELSSTPSADPLILQMHHFVDVITERCQPIVSAADGLNNLKVVDAVLSSAKSGTVRII